MKRMTPHRKEVIVRDHLVDGLTRPEIERKHGLEMTDEELAWWVRLYQTQGGRDGLSLHGIRRSRGARSGKA